MFGFILLLLSFFCLGVVFFTFRVVAVPSGVPTIQVCVQLNSTYEDCCWYCTYEHLRVLLRLYLSLAK